MGFILVNHNPFSRLKILVANVHSAIPCAVPVETTFNLEMRHKQRIFKGIIDSHGLESKNPFQVLDTT